jgi:hypothetical protein
MMAPTPLTKIYKTLGFTGMGGMRETLRLMRMSDTPIFLKTTKHQVQTQQVQIQQVQIQKVQIQKVQIQKVQSTSLTTMRMQTHYKDEAKGQLPDNAGRDSAKAKRIQATGPGQGHNPVDLWQATNTIKILRMTALGHLEARYGLVRNPDNSKSLSSA